MKNTWKLMIGMLLTVVVIPMVACSSVEASKNGGDKYLNNENENSGVHWRSANENDSAFIAQRYSKELAVFGTKYSDEEAAKLRKQEVANTVTPIKTIPAKGVEELCIDSSGCGIAVEPIEGTDIKISFVGAKDQTKFKVSAVVNNNILNVSAFSVLDKEIYIDADADERINTVLIQVPDKVLNSITIKDQTSIVLIADMDVPVSGDTINGMIKIKNDSITFDNNIHCVNGGVFLLADSISGNQNASSVNGRACIQAKTVKGEQKLYTVNGNASLLTETQEGRAELDCVNGILSAEIGSILGEVDAMCINGFANVTLTKTPTNLTFTENVAHNGNAKLPSGWKGGRTIGNGKPKLSMSAQNGNISLEIKNK